MASLRDIVAYLDGELGNAGFEDSSANGLQVEGRAEVRKVGLAVDAWMRSFLAAEGAGCDLLVVHHGLVWGGGVKAVRGVTRRRLAFLLEKGIGLYASHLPLDAHPEWGNNVGLARILGLEDLEPFARYRGGALSLAGRLPAPAAARAVADRMAAELGAEVRIAGDPEAVLASLGVVSGGGTMALAEAAERGLDGFFTGEGGHGSDLEAADSGLTVIYAGHYETETPGVKAVGAALRERFGVETEFLDVGGAAPSELP